MSGARAPQPRARETETLHKIPDDSNVPFRIRYFSIVPFTPQVLLLLLLLLHPPSPPSSRPTELFRSFMCTKYFGLWSRSWFITLTRTTHKNPTHPAPTRNPSFKLLLLIYSSPLPTHYIIIIIDCN